MKKAVSFLLLLSLLFTLAGCAAPAQNSAPKDPDAIDVDLTQLSSTMVYSEVYNMMNTPDDYIGKTVKMTGQFALYQATDENGQAVPDTMYFACIVADATACCSQGIEFVLEGDYSYPDDYPEVWSEITVTGEFQTYMEGDRQFSHLVHAVLET